MRLITSKVVHRPYPHKLVDRERFDRALADAKAVGADDGLLLTVGGQVAETAIWGVFWWEDGRVAAPALEIGILPGRGAGPDRGDRGRDRRAEGHAGGDPGHDRCSSRTRCAAWCRSPRSTVRRCRIRRKRRGSRAASGLDPSPSDAVVFAALERGLRLPAVVVAQSVRAPDCGSGGCGFKSRQPPW